MSEAGILLALALLLGGQRSAAQAPARSVKVGDFLVTARHMWVRQDIPIPSSRFHSVVVEVSVKNISQRVSNAVLVCSLKVKPDADYLGRFCRDHECGGGLGPPETYQMLPGEQSTGGLLFQGVRNGTTPVTLSFNGANLGVSLAGLMESSPSKGHTGERIFRVGGDVSPPVPIYEPEPEYSARAREANLQGTDVLSVVVTPQGNVEDIRVVTPLGRGLDEEAVRTVRTWHYKPCMKDGKPVSCRVDIPVTFRLF